MFRTAAIQKNLLILIGIISFSYVTIFLLSPKDITDYTVADTEYYRETKNRLLLKTAYDYNKESIQAFPETLGEWRSYNFRYSDAVYKNLRADILMSRAYTNSHGDLVWMDIINSKIGESFHKQRICVEGAGWTVVNESIIEFRIANPPDPFIKLYTNRLDIRKGDKKQVMVYWFMFKRFGGNDAVTMIRLSSPVKYNETMTFEATKTFVEEELFDAMYRRTESDNITVAEYIVRKYGKTGILAITMGVLVPIGLVFLGINKRIKFDKEV